MRKLTMIAALLALVLAMAAPAWADGPGVEVVTGWWAANTTGLEVVNSWGASRGSTLVTGSIPQGDTQKPDSIAAIEDAYKVNGTGVESALGTFHDDISIAYSSGLIAYMGRVGFNPGTVGGPNIPPGSVTPAMMPNGYLLIDDGGQLSPGQTPKALAGAVTTPPPVSQNTQAPAYVKPQPSDVQTQLTPQEVTTTSPSVPAPGQGSSAPQALTKDQQKAAAEHVPESYVTNPPAAHVPQTAPAGKPFPWKWVYIGGGALLLIVAAVVLIMRNRRGQYGW